MNYPGNIIKTISNADVYADEPDEVSTKLPFNKVLNQRNFLKGFSVKSKYNDSKINEP